MIAGPSSAVVAVTLRCNSRCTMCGIWKSAAPADLPVQIAERLPSSLRQVNLSGGEPFLRDDLPEIVAAVRGACPRARLVLNTNGSLPGRIRALAPALLAAAPKLAVRVSIDGKPETHESIRGTPGGYRRALDSLAALRASGVRDLGIFMTVWAANAGDVGAVYDLAEREGVELGIGLAYPSPIFFGADVPPLAPADAARLAGELDGLAAREYARARPKRWARGWFALALREFGLRGKRPIPCGAGRDFFYLDPEGAAFACHLTSHRLGSLVEEGWPSLARSGEARAAVTALAGCERCWMVCTIAGAGPVRSFAMGVAILRGRVRARRRQHGRNPRYD